MLFRSTAVAAALAVLHAASASGAIFFTFDDPSTVREVTYVAAAGASPGTLTFDPNVPVQLVVDGSAVGLGVQMFTATLLLEVQVGPASFVGNLLTAPASGSFEFVDVDSGDSILHGSIASGGLISFFTTGTLVATSSNNSLAYSAGPKLLEMLRGNEFLVPIHDASFSLSGIMPLPTINEHGYLSDFQANASFVGNTEVIPSPGAAAVLTALALLTTRRRRALG